MKEDKEVIEEIRCERDIFREKEDQLERQIGYLTEKILGQKQEIKEEMEKKWKDMLNEMERKLIEANNKIKTLKEQVID